MKRRPVYIKAHKRKHTKGVKSHTRMIIVQRRGIIPYNDKRIFAVMSGKDYKREYGGLMDFGHGGGLERFTVDIGKKDMVTRNINEDYEILWHTHPGDLPGTIVPSATDLRSLLKSKQQQGEIVFNRGQALAIIKTDKINKSLARMPIKKIEHYFDHKIDEAENSSIDKSGKVNEDIFLRAFTRSLSDDGFVVQRTPDNAQQIIIPIKVKEKEG
jgi:hypothetical protein